VIVFILAATLGQPPTVSTAGPPGYLPADGFRVRFTTDTGSRASEWAIDQSSQFINAGPVHFSFWMNQAQLNYKDTTAVRLSTVYANPAGQDTAREDDFMVIADDGLRTGVEARSWGSSRFYFPGRLDVSAQMAAGHSWTSEGSAWVLGSVAFDKTSYKAEYSAAAATSRDLQVRRCLVVTMKLSIGTSADPPVTKTWCPGLGIVAVDDAQGSWRATEDSVSLPAQPEGTFDWSSAERLQFAPHSINDLSVKGAIQAAPMAPPALLSDGTVVVAQKIWPDSLALNLAAEPITSAWRVRPAGSTTASATLGGITLIADSNLKLVAYDSHGRWLWQVTLPDEAIVAPVRLGDAAVVTTLAGSVTAFDLASGAVKWSHRLNDSIRLDPSVGSDRIVVADQSGKTVCFDTGGIEQWSIQLTSPDRFLVVPGAKPVVVVRESGAMASGYSLADGTRLWQQHTTLKFTDMIRLDTVLAVRDGNLTIGMDPTTGARLWAWQTERTYAGIGGGRGVLLLANQKLILLDDHGKQLKEWPLDLADLDQKTVFMSAAWGRVLVWAPRRVFLGVLG
jgi:outer membrane protein assembly factor BamB